MYCPPWDVRIGLNVRLPPETMMPPPLVITPFEFFHDTTGVMEVFPTSDPTHISVYVCPADGLPVAVMVTNCANTGNGNS